MRKAAHDSKRFPTKPHVVPLLHLRCPVAMAKKRIGILFRLVDLKGIGTLPHKKKKTGATGQLGHSPKTRSPPGGCHWGGLWRAPPRPAKAAASLHRWPTGAISEGTAEEDTRVDQTVRTTWGDHEGQPPGEKKVNFHHTTA